MVVLKRKPETERRVEYGSVIDIPERKSFAASQSQEVETDLYTTRQSFSGTSAAGKTSAAVMPKIDRTAKEAVMPKQAVSNKTKVLLAAYIIIAIVLAAVVIGTGVAITEAGKRATDLENRIGVMSIQVEQQAPTISELNDPEALERLASDYGLVKAGEPVVIELVETVDAPSYNKTTNAFDKICDFLSNIFN